MNPNPPTPEPQWPTGAANQPPSNQPPPNPNWQPAPPSNAGQPQYGAPTPAPPGAQYGQYVPPGQPSQYPGQPSAPYAQSNQYPGQPNAPYAQPNQSPQPYPQPPYPGYQPPVSAPQRPNGQRNTMMVVGAGILVVAVIAFFVLRGGGGGSSLTGTWVGPVTATFASDGSTQQYALSVTLNESSGGQLTGSGVSCDGSSTPTSSAVTGTHSGSSVTLQFDAGNNYTGHLSGGQLSLTATGLTDTGDNITITVNMHRGTSSEFQAICNTIPTPSA